MSQIKRIEIGQIREVVRRKKNKPLLKVVGGFQSEYYKSGEKIGTGQTFISLDYLVPYHFVVVNEKLIGLNGDIHYIVHLITHNDHFESETNVLIKPKWVSQCGNGFELHANSHISVSKFSVHAEDIVADKICGTFDLSCFFNEIDG